MTWTLSLTQTKYHVIEERMAEQEEQEQSLFYKKFDKESGIFLFQIIPINLPSRILSEQN